MYVRDYMTRNVITVPPTMLIHDAQQLMRQHAIHRLPVVDGGELVGIVTQSRLREIAPSPATSLSIWELNYLLAKMTVTDAMVRNVIATTPDTTLEDAALLGNRHSVGALPVLEGPRLVGIITHTDIYKIFVGVLGTREQGVRLHIQRRYGQGAPDVGEIVAVLVRHGSEIHSIFKIQPPGHGQTDVIARLSSPGADAALTELASLGYQVDRA